MKPQVIVVCGPTATGKTRLGIELAEQLNGEIVSADSMQIYRRMDIGTAKATAEERARCPHHMLDVAEPWEDYSVSRYVQEAGIICDALLAAGKTPILVGGTGLYIDSLLSGRDFAGRDTGDESLRAALNDEYDARGGEAMLETLRTFDPERAAKLHPADRRRIVRAIEIYQLTGKTITAHDAETRARPPRYRAFTAALSYLDRANLYARIDSRVDAMVAEGLFDEVESLVIISMEPMEALRYLPFLSEDGWIITSSTPFVNIPNYPEIEVIKGDLEKLPNVIMLDIEQAAKDAGVPRSANVILLGAAQKALGIEYEKLEDAIRRVFGRKGDAIVEANIKALAIGKQAQR